MSNPQSVYELDTPQQERFQRVEYWVERSGWSAMALVLVLALLGLLGPGPLTHERTAAPDGSVTVEHYLFQRYEAPHELRIELGPAVADSQHVRLLVSRSFTDEVTVERITPEPEWTELTDAELIYVFRARDLDYGSQVVIRYTNSTFGRYEFLVGTTQENMLRLWHFAFP